MHGLSDLLIYPLDGIMAAKTLGLVCNKVNTHWTRLGAFIFYDAIMKRLAGIRRAQADTRRLSSFGARKLWETWEANFRPLGAAYNLNMKQTN